MGVLWSVEGVWSVRGVESVVVSNVRLESLMQISSFVTSYTSILKV